MTEEERKASIEALEARRKARGMSDPLNRLRAHNEAAIKRGATVYVNQPAKEKE